MQFDWQRAIERNFEAIESIVLRLYALAGITSLAPLVATLPRHLHRRILAMLRPTEYAARRLIAMAACTLALDVGPVHARAATGPSSPLRGEDTKACEQSELAEVGEGAAKSPRLPPFPLFDPLKPFGAPWLTPEEIAALDDPAPVRWTARTLPPEEPVDARGLCRRIAALRYALEDIDGQALRLARWRARRHLDTARPKRWSPMRPGHPPGWKRRPKTAVEQVLKECNFLAHDAWAGPDTS